MEGLGSANICLVTTCIFDRRLKKIYGTGITEQEVIFSESLLPITAKNGYIYQVDEAVSTVWDWVNGA